MAEQAGMVVTDGRVLLSSDIDEPIDLSVIPRVLRINGQTVTSDDRVNALRSMARDAQSRGRGVQVLAPDREHFLHTYLDLAKRHSQVVSVHYLGTMDGAAREARVCRQLMYPYQQIEIYEAKTLQGGANFLLRLAASVAGEGASAPQVLALLRYLETHMHTLLLAPGLVAAQPWSSAKFWQRLISLIPATETLWYFDPRSRKLQVMNQGIGLHARIGPALKQRWDTLRWTPVLRYQGYHQRHIEQLSASLQAVGLEEPQLEPVTASYLPCLPRRFVEIVLQPMEDDLRRLRALIQDPIWWKGEAA